MNIQILEILDKELYRQDNTIELIASENFASQAVRDLCGSVFTNKYAEGYPSKRYYNGCDHMDEIENLAINAACKIFDCEFANVQPHSGVNANTAVYQAFLKPGDTILGMDLASGGHLSHGAPPTLSGKVYNAHTYGVDNNGFIDYEEVANLAQQHKPDIIVAGASAYPRQIDWVRFRAIADSVGAYLLCDMAHYSGLIAGKAYKSPLPYADVVTSTTHKTLRGPRGGIILWNNPDYTKKINSAIFPGTQGGPLMNIIAAKAQCFLEADSRHFQTYAREVVESAKALAKSFMYNDYHVATSGTDSHIVLVDLSNKNISGREAADVLEKNGITVNKNGVPNDPRNFIETSGIRLGTAAEVTRGHDREWFSNLGKKIVEILNENSNT
tara:strand:- start:10481 stop:11635 length:1155 start_codon:yes stop_codon:yes gene_type:complete